MHWSGWGLHASPEYADDGARRVQPLLHINPEHLGAPLGKATFLRLAVRVQPEIESALAELMGGKTEPAVLETRTADSEIAEENIIAAAVAAEDYGTAAEHCRTLAGLLPDYYEA